MQVAFLCRKRIALARWVDKKVASMVSNEFGAQTVQKKRFKKNEQ